MKRIFLFSVIAISLVFFCADDKVVLSQEYKPTVIRIAVIKNTDNINLAVRGRYKILSLYTQDILYEGKNLRRTKIIPTLSGLHIGDAHFKIFGVRVEPTRDASIFINNRRFRGSIDIVRTQDLKLLVVNYVDVENYLYGVLYHEVSHRWPMEALKAQAIVARTFALYQHRVRKNEDYDLTSDVYSQLYGGRTSEKRRTTKAVNLTKGKVLTFKGDIFPTYYHATCGGYTENASRVWNINLDPLKGVKCGYCQRSPHYRWHRIIWLREIEKRLKEHGYDIKGITSIAIEARDNSGRISNLILKSRDSQINPVRDFALSRSVKGISNGVKISAYRFRLIIDPNLIRSTNFDVTLYKRVAHFEGFGWGHGVGLCQWGSYFMSRKGYKVEEILKYYYPGSEIKDIRELGD